MEKQTEKDRLTFRVKTSSFPHEDFYLDTTLDPKEVIDVLLPLKLREQNDKTGKIFYDNGNYAYALQEAYPDDVVIWYSEMDEIII